MYDKFDQIYGSVKITRELKKDEALESVSRNTVAKATREMGLNSKISRKLKPGTPQVDPSKEPAPNLLHQEFQGEAPNQKWMPDITYLATLAAWVYLAVAIDLFSCKVVDWAISESLITR